MAADLLSEVVIELLEALILGGDVLEVDPGEGLVLGAEIFHELFGEGDTVREPTLVMLLGLVEEVREVLLDVGELLVGQLRRQGAWRVFNLNHSESVCLN